MNLLFIRIRDFNCTYSSLIFALLVFPQMALANEGESSPGLGLYWLNFLIYCGLVYYFSRSSIPAAWKRRCERLEVEVGKGKIELQAASERLELARQRLGSIPAESEKIKATLAQEGTDEARMILAEARQRREQIVAAARESAQAERKSVAVGIRKELADIVIERIRQQARAEMGGARDTLWRERALGSIQRIFN